jgi:hypothetical protein
VEYRRFPAADVDDAVGTALWFVAAALSSDISLRAAGGQDREGTPVAASDIISVRALDTETEWAREHG